MSATEIGLLLARTNALEEFDFPSADTVLRNATALARTLFSCESPHVAELGYVLFRPNDIICNTGHHMNHVVWNEGIERLRRVLNAMAYELKIAEAKCDLQPPEKVTLKWLSQHVSVHCWLVAGSVVAGVFSLGFALGKVISLVQNSTTP